MTRRSIARAAQCRRMRRDRSSTRSETESDREESSNRENGNSVRSNDMSTTDSRAAGNGNVGGGELGQGLNLKMSAKELRAKLAARKKYDPKKESIGFKDKFDIVQKL